MCQEIRKSQIGQVHIGGCMHVFVLEYHADSGDVAEDSDDENDRVDHRYGNDSGQRKMLRP